MVIIEPAVPWKTKMAARSGILGLGSRLYPGNMQRIFNKDLTRFMQSLSRQRQNRASKRKVLLAGCLHVWPALFQKEHEASMLRITPSMSALYPLNEYQYLSHFVWGLIGGLRSESCSFFFNVSCVILYNEWETRLELVSRFHFGQQSPRQALTDFGAILAVIGGFIKDGAY